jgi:hypothetical protein
VEVERHVVVGVEAGGHHDVQRHLCGDPLDARHVATQADHRGVDDGPHPGVVGLLQLLHGVGDPVVLAAPLRRVVLLHVGGEHEDVLVHQRDAEVGGVDGSPGGLDGRHGGLLQGAATGGDRSAHLPGARA